MNDQISVAINHLQHVGIPVTNINISEAFYKRLGFSNVMQSLFMMEGKEGICIMMKKNTMIIELYQLPGEKIDEIKTRKDGHVDHIAFDVDDVDAVFILLKDASFNVIEDAPVFLSFWNKGCKYFNILGPDGERLEFNQIIK